jgi:arylamine N-acetyltransferase
MLTYLHPEAVKKFLRRNNLENSQVSLLFLTKLGEAFQKMPYENLTKLIRYNAMGDTEARIRLPELLYEEFLRFGTGGTCFSMTYFLQTILRSCGFETYPIMADRPLAQNTHCLSIIILEGKKYILDPGFMINQPLELTRLPTKHILRHNNIIIGAKGTIPLPEEQSKYFAGLNERSLPFEATNDERNHYTIATFLGQKLVVRYFLKDMPVAEDSFLEHWTSSFGWPTLSNVSITQVTDSGYHYARNDFLRTTTKDGRKQERLKNGLEFTLGKTFNIDMRIIRNAFEVLKAKRR